jgi:bifunctional DNase/RNase
MLIAVEIASFAVHAEKNTPLIILKETGGERTLAAPIATPEASAIAIKSLNVRCETALTIDVLKTVVESLGGKLDKVVIRAAGNDFSARLHIFSDTRVHAVECSCGDGIALAMRSNAPIFVDEGLFLANEVNSRLSEKEILRQAIAAAATLEFGTYYLQ